jgi:hypothetical protein
VTYQDDVLQVPSLRLSLDAAALKNMKDAPKDTGVGLRMGNSAVAVGMSSGTRTGLCIADVHRNSIN